MSAGRRLIRALEASAAAAGCPLTVTAATEQPWSSATFVGARHRLTIQAGGGLTAWLDRLAAAPPALPGHVVAELVINRVVGGAQLEALTLEA